MKNDLRPLVAELVGTFLLTFAVASSSVITVISTPVVAGLTLGLCVYIIGTVSGSHINPAVSIGLWSIKKIDASQTLRYVTAQVVGALLALFFFAWLEGLEVTGIVQDTDIYMFLGEAIGAAMLVFGISAVVYKQVSDAAAGLVIGGSLTLGAFIALFVGSNGVLNPAVAFGTFSLSFMHVLGPVVGGVVGAHLGKYLFEKRKK